ncbi:5560_t:CDS:2 [Rhizophagus irregularis]|nr:5560_t:CDS:2 [Rhizophagus irregularis]
MTSNEILEIAQNLNSLKPLKKEQILLNSTKENPKIFSKINDLINEYNDITINLPIMKLLAPSKLSRAKKTPRPQNLFILYRRNLSKGLCKINPKSVGKSSQVASLLWKSISEREREFWRQLSIIAKEKHNTIYSDYKYEPNKKKKRNRYKVSSKKINRKDNPQIFINTLPDLSPYVNEPSTTILKNEQIHSLTQNLELPHYYYQPALTVIPTIPTISHPQFVITSPTVGNELYNTSYDLSKIELLVISIKL